MGVWEAANCLFAMTASVMPKPSGRTPKRFQGDGSHLTTGTSQCNTPMRTIANRKYTGGRILFIGQLLFVGPHPISKLIVVRRHEADAERDNGDECSQ